jgi:menaquinone-9 beta-reductase
MRKTVTIIGGGLAGLTLGLGLRREGIPVVIYEAGHYPRHKVCGEFISGAGQDVLQRLNLLDAIKRAGAFLACTGAFTLGRIFLPVRPLPQTGICISRFELDALLARQFSELGGDLQENLRWRGQPEREGTVIATGRRVAPVVGGWRWFGLKIHARHAKLRADLEIHGFDNAYIGVCRVGLDRVNVCGLFRKRAEDRGPITHELLAGSPGSALHSELDGADFDLKSFCSVAGLSLNACRASQRAECCIGDALTMVPPVTGNGMSMAFEAAAIALAPLAAYSRGTMTWPEAKTAIAHACDRAFARRLFWAGWLQRIMFTPLARSVMTKWILSSSTTWRFFFTHTR